MRSTPAAAMFTAAPSLASSPLGVGLKLFLESAATWLAGFPANPITDALQGAVFVVRRTLFPATVGVVTAPIKIPLTLVDVCFGKMTDGSCSGTTVQRLGIWATLGSGNPIPQFFEFDTGAAGFHAAYASTDPTASPWWGYGVATGAPITKSFDSGLSYGGVEATTTVSFYSSATSAAPLLTTARVQVGQMDTITDGKGDPLWNGNGSVTGEPPVDGQFYGDFGAAPSYEANGIDNLLDELTFARGVTPGYRVHIDETGESWLQIGLTSTDTEDPTGEYFAMVPDPSAPGGATNAHSGTRYFAPQLFLATIHIDTGSGQHLISDAVIGITPDTGADTTLHNTNRSSHTSAITYTGITGDGANGYLDSGLYFSLSGTTTSGDPADYLHLITDDVKDGVFVNVQNGTSDKQVYYLNTGIQLFFQNDVVYNVGAGTLGLIP